MIRAFVENLLEAFRDPRESARRIIAKRMGMADCLLMVVLAFAVQGLLAGVLSLGDGREGPGLGARAAELGLQVVLYLVLATAVHRVGARFGGHAGPEASAAVVAWHYLVTAFLAPLNVIGMRSVGSEGALGLGFLLVPLSVGLSIWLFASFVAEAHGFRKLGPVIAVSVGGFMALGLITMTFLALVSGGSPG